MIQHRITGWQGCRRRRHGLCGPFSACVFPACILYLCGWVRVCGKMSYPHSCPMCTVMSAMQHLVIFSGVGIVYVLCLDASQGFLLDERITGAVGNRRMIFWLYTILSGGDTPAITGSLTHLLLVKCFPVIGSEWEQTYGYKSIFIVWLLRRIRMLFGRYNHPF